MGGEEVDPTELFPFLGEGEREMTPEETEAFFASLAAQAGGRPKTEGDDGGETGVG